MRHVAHLEHRRHAPDVSRLSTSQSFVACAGCHGCTKKSNAAAAAAITSPADQLAGCARMPQRRRAFAAALPLLPSCFSSAGHKSTSAASARERVGDERRASRRAPPA